MPDITQLLYSIPDARAALGGIGHSKFYDLVAEGELQILKMGRRSFVEPHVISRYVESLREKAEGKPA